MKKFYKYCLALSLALMTTIGLNGCSSVAPSDGSMMSSSQWQGMQERLKGIKSVSLSGRVAVKYAKERFSANFLYQGSSAENFTLRLSSSIGVQLAALQVTPQKAILKSSDQEYVADNAQELFAKVTNMNLPLNDFHKLILGIAPNNKSTFNSDGSLEQSIVPDFVINYRGFSTHGDLAIPNNIQVLGPDLEMVILSRKVQKLER